MPCERTSFKLPPTFLPTVSNSSKGSIEYPPPGTLARAQWKTRSGKEISKHRWDVYDHVLKIPRGKVTTYKDVALAIGSGSARSVGTALRNNPFAPYVPCHRVIASNLFIGGFFGVWGKGKGIGQDESENCTHKRQLLVSEGVQFDENDFLSNVDQRWRKP